MKSALSIRSKAVIAAVACFAAAVTPAIAGAAAPAASQKAAKASEDDFGDESPSKPAVAVMPVQSLSLYGSIGLLRTATATIDRPRVLRLQLLTEYFRATQFLQSDPFDTNRRWGLRLGASYAPTSWLETFLMVTGSFNDNSRGTPTQSNLFGDITVGLKGSARLGKAFALGAEASVLILSGGGPRGYTADAIGARLRALATFDVRAIAPSVPLRFHANAGGVIDNSSALLQPGYGQLERFALRIGSANRFALSLGLDAPVNAYVTPFLEWGLEVPVGVLPAPSATNKEQGFAAYPNVVSAGAKLSPFPWLSLLAAVDLGLTSRGQLGLTPTPPWQFYLAVSFAIDTAPPAAPAPPIAGPARPAR